MPELKTIPIDLINPDPDNARSSLGDLTDLADSIRALGVIEPIVVRWAGDDGWVIVAGHRRHAAAKQAGETELDVIVRDDVTNEERLATFIAENLHRENLTPVERASVFAQLLGCDGVTQRDVAKLCGVSQATVSKSIALLKLPPKAQKWAADGLLTLDDAAAIAALPAHWADKWCSRPFPPSSVEVSNAKHRQKDLDSANQKLDALEKSGQRIIRTLAPRIGSSDSVPKIATSLWLRNRDAWNGHSALPCHAWMLPTYGAEPEAVCTSPADHVRTPVDTPTSGTPAAADAASVARRTAEPAAAHPDIDIAGELRALAEQMVARFDPGVAVAHAAPFFTSNVDIADAWDEACCFAKMSDDTRVQEHQLLDDLPGWLVRNPGASTGVLYAIALGDSLLELVSAARTGNGSRAGRHLAHLRSHPAYPEILSADTLAALAALTEPSDSNRNEATTTDTNSAETAETPAGPVVTVVCDDTSKTPYTVDCTECDHIARHSNETAALQRAETHIATTHSGAGTVRIASPAELS